VGKDDWASSDGAGCVHTDLLQNKLIEDSYLSNNDRNQQWIGKTDWEYQTTHVTSELLQHDQMI